MNKSALASLSLTALAMVLHADSNRVLRTSFPDGTGLEIFTETTGSSQIDPRGEMGIGPGAGSQDLVNRVVRDRANNILFVYNLEASRGVSQDTAKIRILPISAATEAGMLRSEASHGRPFSGAHLPTVAGVREFPAVKIGEAVTLDILYNPSSGEKIFDVLRPVPSTSQVLSVASVVAPEAISLRQIALRVNGQAISSPSSFIIGSAVRIDIPRYGSFVVVASDHPGFAAIGHAEGRTLSWDVGRDRVEITSGTNVLTRSGKGVLWVYHDPHYRPDVVGLQAADSVDWLLPRK